MAKRLIPTLNRILVEKIVPPSKTTAGILLPEKSNKVKWKEEKFLFSPFAGKDLVCFDVGLDLYCGFLTFFVQLNSGKVVAVGPGQRDRNGNVIPVAVKEGDTVLLPEYGGTQVKLGEKELVSGALNLYIFWVLYMTFHNWIWNYELRGFYFGLCAGTICIGMRISWGLFTINSWLKSSVTGMVVFLLFWLFLVKNFQVYLIKWDYCQLCYFDC